MWGRTSRTGGTWAISGRMSGPLTGMRSGGGREERQGPDRPLEGGQGDLPAE